jgi:hypothetical protein
LRGFVELPGFGCLGGGAWSGFGWIGCWFDHDRLSVIEAATRFATKRMWVAAGRRLVDRWKNEARRARRRPANSHHQVRGGNPTG